MVMSTEIMKLSTLEEAKKEMKFKIPDERFQPFVSEVIDWYQKEAITSRFAFIDIQPLKMNPAPNLFHLLERESSHGQRVLDYFATPNEFNSFTVQEIDDAFHDVSIILNKYNMFYCYQDDSPGARMHFYNPFVAEVW